MRTLIDYRPALRKRSGVGQYIHRLVHALADLTDEPRSLSITIFSSSWKDRLQRAPSSTVRVVDRRIPGQLLNLLWHRLGWPPIETLAGATFDVVHSPHPLLLPTRAAARVITIHDLDFLDHPERTRAEIRRDYAALVRAHAHEADRVVVSSRYTAGQVERRLGVPPQNISLCAPGAPDWPARSKWPEAGYILFVGSLEPRKNVGMLLRAYEALVSRRPDVPRLVLAGTATPAARPWLETLAQPPLRGRVRHVGYVPEDSLRELYEGACLLVLPSLEEGFGLPVLEAMTVGVPVVASERGSLPEVLGDAGLLIDPENEQSLAAGIERMVVDRNLARSAVERGLRRARTYTWRSSALALRTVYDEALAARGRR